MLPNASERTLFIVVVTVLNWFELTGFFGFETTNYYSYNNYWLVCFDYFVYNATTFHVILTI